MDSFYDAPRLPPEPLSRELLTAVPLVPEISVLCSSNTPRNPFTPYSQWKQGQNILHRDFGCNKENINSFTQNQQNNSILKKQVRFESPTFQPEVKKPITEQNTGKPLNRNNFPKDNLGKVPNFEQMYLANIPNRQLDLSIIDVPKRPLENNTNRQSNDIEIKEKETPKMYKEFLKSQPDLNGILLNDSITDIFNYQRGHLVPKISSVSNDASADIHGLNQNNFKKDDKYFQSVSKAISQRTINKPTEIHNYNLDILNSPTSIQKYVPYASQEQCKSTIDKSSKQELNKSNQKDYHKANKQDTKHSGEFHIEELQKCGCCKTVENNALNLNSVEDFTTKDLLKIITQQSKQIAQQNEQLLLLQHQVSELIAMKKNKYTGCFQCDSNVNYISRNNALHMPRNAEGFASQNVETIQDKCITSTQHGEQKVLGNLKRNQLPNFSVGMTTSFELSFRRTNQKNQNDFHQKPGFIEARTNQQIEHENGNKETLIDASMVFQEPIRVKEQCPSPEPSIKINMNDFEDSDLDDESTQFEATFYRNLMGQVNKILQKAQIETAEEIACNMASSRLNNKTMYKVKEATLKHLRRIGVNLPNTENFQNSSSSDEADEKSYDQEDISFAVKQLLMKYLPADHLARLAVKERRPGDQIDLIPTEKIGIIKKRPEFSFASVQYMKKYNLIAGSHKDFNQGARPIPSQSPKILDITKLKQQPKLL